MKQIRYLLTLLLLIVLATACSPAIDAQDLVHGDVSYNGTLVTSATSSDDLSPYYNYLFLAPSSASLNHTDLAYDLEIRTYDRLLTYKLLFDMTQEKAIAVNQEGSFYIPYSWLTSYLEAYPIPTSFSYLNPPSFQLVIDGHKMPHGMTQSWFLHPTDQVTYPLEAQVATSENYHATTSDIHITGTFSNKSPDALSLDIISFDGSESYDNVTLDALPTPTAEGAYRYELSAYWTSPDTGYSGTIIYNFGVSISLPAAYRMNKSIYEPGDCMTLLIDRPSSLDYRVETPTYTRTTGLFYYGEDLVGLIPLDSRTSPGEYDLYIYEDSTDQLLDTLRYTVAEKTFERQDLTVSSSTASLKSDDNYSKDAAKFGDAKTYSVGEKLWEGTFLQPVEGRISTEYATIRYVNGGDESSRHSGLDIAAPRGTPVLAANNGIVTFASDLIVSGNVIVLDHGYGLFTSYVHLDELYVEKGDTITKGDIIGAVGSTGYSTGPHLHWTVWKNGVYLNPWKFIDEDPLAVFESNEVAQ